MAKWRDFSKWTKKVLVNSINQLKKNFEKRLLVSFVKQKPRIKELVDELSSTGTFISCQKICITLWWEVDNKSLPGTINEQTWIHFFWWAHQQRINLFHHNFVVRWDQSWPIHLDKTILVLWAGGGGLYYTNHSNNYNAHHETWW